MQKYLIQGGSRISGEVRVQGAKNSSLPVLAATVVCSGESVLHNCPDLLDTEYAVKYWSIWAANAAGRAVRSSWTAPQCRAGRCRTG